MRVTRSIFTEKNVRYQSSEQYQIFMWRPVLFKSFGRFQVAEHIEIEHEFTIYTIMASFENIDPPQHDASSFRHPLFSI